MKKRKILFLLIATLCVTLLLAGCNGDGNGDNGGGNDGSGIFDFFELVDDTKVLYTDISELEGDVESYNVDENLVATKETDVNAIGEVVETLKVLNIKTGEVIYETTHKYDYSTEEDHVDTTTYHIDLSYYPLIQVEHRTLDWSSTYDSDLDIDVWSSETSSKYDYVVAKRDGDTVYYSSKVASPEIIAGVNFYICKVGTSAYVFDGSLEKIESSVTDAMINLNYNDFNAYRDGYFYAIGSRVTVYDKNRIPVVNYDVKSDSEMMVANMLNNGNILVQSLTEVEYDAEKYSVNLMGQKFLLESCIIDYKTGESTNVELDHVVMDNMDKWSSDFYDYSYTGLELGGNYENYALIMRCENDTTYNKCEYAVLDNSGKILYTVPCTAVNNALSYDDIYFHAEDRYITSLMIGENLWYYLFNEKGEAIAPICEYDTGYEIVNDHILVGAKLYDKNMKLVCDFNAEGLCQDIVVEADNIFIMKQNILGSMMNGYETYVYDFSESTTKLIANGVSSYVIFADYFDAANNYLSNVYAVYEYQPSAASGINMSTLTIYNSEGTAIFVANTMMADSPYITFFEDAMIIEYADKTYLLK